MSDELDPNAALFGGDEPEMSDEEAHMKETFGKNPNRTSAFSDLFLKDMLETVEAEEELPDEAKKHLIFKMTANSVLDIIMESLSPDTREEVAACVDGYIGMCMVNMKNQVDLMSELRKALMTVKQEANESDDDYERRPGDMEEAWWSIPQPILNGRTPDDAIREEMKRYGLDE